ncbi:MAG: glycosyltransferase [Solirubrobacterales bacterium]
MRVLVVMNFGPDQATPQRGQWVVDQVEALKELGIEAELFTFQPGRSNYLPATRRIRQILRERQFDLVHAHYGLAGWCARLAGADPLVVTFHGTDVRHRVVGPMSRMLTRRIDLVAGVSKALFEIEAGRPGLPLAEGRNAVLPCGADLSRFSPEDRRESKMALGLDPDTRYLFFPADPARPEKRFDRFLELADECDAAVITGGGIPPEEMSRWINASHAVVVTSDYEGFGLTCLESLACDVPVISTPVGIAPHALRNVRGTLCADFDVSGWAAFASGLLAEVDPRASGGQVSEALSAGRMAERVVFAYEEILGRRGGKPVLTAKFGNDGDGR